MAERPTQLDQEYRFFLDHASEFNQRFDGQYIIIAGEEVLGGYADQEEAVRAAREKNLKPGQFLLRFCTTRQDQMQYFRSRVAFR